jgi:hypothetical protein
MSNSREIRRSRTFLLALVILLTWANHAAASDALQLFKSYFVTGDYMVGGIGLRSQGVLNTQVQQIVGGSVQQYATGTISMSGVPTNADILAAFLYWQTIETTSTPYASAGTFRGVKVVGKQIAPAGTLACAGSGGGAGNASNSQYLRVYRADVLRYLPVPATANGTPTGQRLVNDADLTANGFPLTVVSLPDSGSGGSTSPSTGNQAELLEGVSLLVIYRTPAGPLKSVVLYDGGYTFSANNPLMKQTVQGFYEASKIGPRAQMTHIVGNGRNFQEQLTVNGVVPPGVSPNNPFSGALGSAWDNLTFDVSSLMSGNDSQVTTQVTPVISSTACLSWAAIVFSSTVQDSDNDGLVDVWETTPGGVVDATDPTGQTHLPDLYDGRESARPGHLRPD